MLITKEKENIYKAAFEYYKSGNTLKMCSEKFNIHRSVLSFNFIKLFKKEYDIVKQKYNRNKSIRMINKKDFEIYIEALIYYKSGKSIRQCAKKFKLSKSAIAYNFAKIDKNYSRIKFLNYVDKYKYKSDFLVYANKKKKEGFTLVELANFLKIPSTTLRPLLVRNNIHFNKIRPAIISNKDKQKVYKIFFTAIRNGTIKKKINCEICNCKKELVGHHCDYSKPLDVLWICRRCHYKWHTSHNAAI